uniref:Uncharacterized protein n=1 Tax=Arundo donax TaxID=35708 RepID=A0A0A9G4L2_ARUDO
MFASPLAPVSIC